jgi:hypothetical protein
MADLLRAVQHVGQNQSPFDADEDIYGNFQEKQKRTEALCSFVLAMRSRWFKCLRSREIGNLGPGPTSSVSGNAHPVKLGLPRLGNNVRIGLSAMATRRRTQTKSEPRAIGND